MRVVVGGLSLVAVALCSFLWWPGRTAYADGAELPAYDISWPQCPDDIPDGDFAFAVIGLNDGRPFTTNECFMTQYRWASTAETNPDVYINLDFPKPGHRQAETGPYGRCEASDDWCRGYNYGYASARDATARALAFRVTPSRFWLDVEMENYWSDSPRNNAQVVRGALDYFLDFNINVGIYGTRYQWGLITGGFIAPGVTPLWVAGAEDRASAAERCGDDSFAFAGGETWLVQYPEGPYDGNVGCRIANRADAATAEVPTKTGPQPLVDRLEVDANRAHQQWTSSEIKRLFHN